MKAELAACLLPPLPRSKARGLRIQTVNHVASVSLTLPGTNGLPAATNTLTPARAAALAQELANDKAQALYSCRPFSNGPLAQLVNGLWVWQDRRGQGLADIEATVKFASDGANPTVSVVLLDSRSAPLRSLRP